MIENTDHCLVCENSKKDFKTGTYCGITNEKPKFINKCSSKIFGKTLEQKIKDVNKAIKLVEITKGKTTLHVITYLSFSIMILIADYIITNYIWKLGWMSSVTLTIGAVGLGMIPMAIAPLNKYNRTIKLAREDKIKLDELLSVYNMSYDIEVIAKEGPHDIVDVETNLKIYTK